MNDPVLWVDGPRGCSRCGRGARYYVSPYWKKVARLCSQCCRELERFYDEGGWPPL